VIREGAYRLEAWLEGKGWIFSNHIRIGVGNGVSPEPSRDGSNDFSNQL